jgi:hypothetical protein
MDTNDKVLQTALRVIAALDKRKAAGRMDATADAKLAEAVASVSTASGRAVLAAWRAVQASGVHAFDPTGGYVRQDVARSPDMALRSR